MHLLLYPTVKILTALSSSSMFWLNQQVSKRFVVCNAIIVSWDSNILQSSVPQLCRRGEFQRFPYSLDVLELLFFVQSIDYPPHVLVTASLKTFVAFPRESPDKFIHNDRLHFLLSGLLYHKLLLSTSFRGSYIFFVIRIGRVVDIRNLTARVG